MDVKKININQSEQTYNIASEIYDVTSNNNGATFESLQSLLSSDNLSTLIPSAVRCGGMTIRFVQSSDNTYVQYRLTSTSFSTTESDWQGVDDEPIVGSDNLVKSGGTFSSINAEISRATAAEENIVNSSSIFAENCYGKFIRELYIERNNTTVTDLHVGTIKRNYGTIKGRQWQFTIKGFVGEKLVNIFNVYGTSADIENNGITKINSMYAEGSNKLIGYMVLDWNQVPSPKYDTNRYNLKDACYNIDFSPSVKSYIETKRATAAEEAKQDILQSGVNIKTINGGSILGSGDIKISGNTVSNININNYNIGDIDIAASLVEKKTIFGNFISIDGIVSNKLPKISIFSKPTIHIVGSDRNISFPTEFYIKINDITKEILNNNPIRSINFDVDKNNTGVADFTYSDDDGNIYI